MTDSIRVVIVEDEEIVREGLDAIVNSDSGLEVVGHAGDGVGAVDAVRKLAPDVVLMDVRMPRMDGVEATRHIVAEGHSARVLVLTTVEDDDVVLAALSAGASGFLLKSAPRQRLHAAIRSVCDGDLPLAPSITRRLVDARIGDRSLASPPLSLTARQVDIVRDVAAGRSNAEIAEHLHLAPATVKGYVSDLLIRHGLRDRAQLVVKAYETGLVRPGTPARGSDTTGGPD